MLVHIQEFVKAIDVSQLNWSQHNNVMEQVSIRMIIESFGLLGLQVAMLGHFWTCPFPRSACSAYCASEWAAPRCPGTLDAGFMCHNIINSVCCASRVS